MKRQQRVKPKQPAASVATTESARRGAGEGRAVTQTGLPAAALHLRSPLLLQLRCPGRNRGGPFWCLKFAHVQALGRVRFRVVNSDRCSTAKCLNCAKPFRNLTEGPERDSVGLLGRVRASRARAQNTAPAFARFVVMCDRYIKRPMPCVFENATFHLLVFD